MAWTIIASPQKHSLRTDGYDPPATVDDWIEGPLKQGGVRNLRPVAGTGLVDTYTVNHQPFNPAVPVPYVIGIIALDEQADLRVAANIVDCEPDSVYIGLPVAVRFVRDVVDESVVVPVFAPA